MRLNLYFDETDSAVQSDLEFFRQRGYVARTLVPEGYESYFQGQARYISAHTSTAIEGNPLTEEQSMLVLVESPHSNSPDELEKVNLEEAYQFISLLAGDKSLKTDEGLIRTLNSIALKNLPDQKAQRRGMYRPGPALIVDADTREVRYRPPPPEWVPELMTSLVTDIQDWQEKHSGPVAAALAHFGLISIHPFEDGNGRTARLVADLILDRTGSSIGGMLSISKVMLDRRAEYYQALREAQGDDFIPEVDVTPFMRFHTDALAAAAAMLEERVVAFNRRRDRLIRDSREFLNPRQVTGFMFMVDIGPLSTSLYARLTNSSQSSALADLTDMANDGIVIRVGAGKGTRYRPNPKFLEAIQK